MMEEAELPVKRTYTSRLFSVQLCIQVFQVLVSFAVVLCGLAVSGVGLWALQSQEELIVISNGDPQLKRIPLSLIVAGICIALLGCIGIVGGLFTRTITGRILLGVYAFVLALLVINEIGIGVSAIYFQEQVLSVFVQSAEKSLIHYGSLSNTTSTTLKWDVFQQKFNCCGASNFTSYRQVFGNNTVPSSCCVSRLDTVVCDSARQNATKTDKDLNTGGCPDAVLETLKSFDEKISVVVLVIGIAQLSGVVLACIIAYISSKSEEKASYSYNRLLVQGHL